jgi:hypothetical protein
MSEMPKVRRKRKCRSWINGIGEINTALITCHNVVNEL